MSTTLSTARRALIRSLGNRLAEYHSITALAVGSVTIGSRANTNSPANKYRNNILFRPEAASAADAIRFAGALTASSGLIAHTGTNYSDTTVGSEVLEIWYDPEIDPSLDIQRMFVDALDNLKVLCRVPLMHGPTDGDMQASATSSWTDSSATSAKQTTTSEVFLGARSMTVTDSGSGLGYTQSGLNRLGRGKQLYVFAIVKGDTGTSRLVVLDGDSNTEASIDTTEEDWVLMKKQVSFGSADEQYRLRPQSVAASDVGDWQAAWAVKPDQLYFDMPSWLTDKMRVVGVSVGRPMGAAGDADTWLAGGMEYDGLEEDMHYRFDRRHADANPYRLNILDHGRQYMSEPLFLEVSCPYSAPYGVTAAFAAEADTTHCPQDLLLAEMHVLMGERWPAKFADLAARGLQEKASVLSRDHKITLPPRRSGWGGLF